MRKTTDGNDFAKFFPAIMRDQLGEYGFQRQAMQRVLWLRDRHLQAILSTASETFTRNRLSPIIWPFRFLIASAAWC